MDGFILLNGFGFAVDVLSALGGSIEACDICGILRLANKVVLGLGVLSASVV